MPKLSLSQANSVKGQDFHSEHLANSLSVKWEIKTKICFCASIQILNFRKWISGFEPSQLKDTAALDS